MSSISFKTITLYGILVTEESFLTGIHSHVASALNKRVLMKAVGKDVPPELYNEILAHCDEESRVTISKIWSEGFSQSERDLKFGSFQAGSVPALQEIVSDFKHPAVVTFILTLSRQLQECTSHSSPETPHSTSTALQTLLLSGSCTCP